MSNNKSGKFVTSKTTINFNKDEPLVRFRQPIQQQSHSLFPIPSNLTTIPRLTTPQQNLNGLYSTGIVQQSSLANANNQRQNSNNNSLIDDNDDCFYDNIQVIIVINLKFATKNATNMSKLKNINVDAILEAKENCHQKYFCNFFYF